MISSIVALIVAIGIVAAPAKPKPVPPAPPVFEGVVVGPDAKPVAGAVVVVRSAADFGDPPTVVRTGADGAFRITPRRRGPLAVRVEARALAGRTIEKAATGTPLRIALARGGTIEGTVRDAASGEPLAGARIEAREDGVYVGAPWEPAVGVITTASDAKGAFKLEGLARGRHTVTATARAAGRASRAGVAPGQRVDLLLVAGSSVSGRVVTPDDKPAAGAAVRVEPEMEMGQSRIAGADAAGRFEIGGIDPGVYRVIATHSDWAVAIVAGVRVDQGADAAVEIVLGSPARVTGRLVEPDERPVTGTIALQEIDGQAAPRALVTLVRAEAGADGRFVLERLPAGSHALAVTGRGVAPRRVTVELGAGQRAVDLGDVVLDPGGRIRGRVRDKSGAPVADAVLRASPDGPPTQGLPPLEGRTDDEGVFVLGGATAAGYQLSVRASGFAPLQQVVEAPSDGVELVLETAGSITGTVVDADGKAVESFDVTVLPSGADRERRFSVMRSAPGNDGRLLVEDVAPGTYAVRVSASARGRQVVSDVKVAVGGVTDLGRIRLAPGGTLRGTVLDAASAPVAGASVEATGSDRFTMMMERERTTTDASGTFQLTGLPPGTMVATATHPQFAPGRSAPVDIEAGRTVQTSIVLTRGGRIEGVVRRRGSGPLPDLWIGARSHAQPQGFSTMLSAVPGPDGRFVIERVPSGRVGVALMARAAVGAGINAFANKDVEVREGEAARVEFVWREILIAGKVTRGGMPLANVRLTARSATGGMMFSTPSGVTAPPSGPQSMWATTREDGSYEMIVGEPGRLSIRADALAERKAYPVRVVEIADADSQTVDLDYPAGGITGIVVDEETGAAIARAMVSATPASPGAGFGGHVMTGADGRFAIDVDAGAFRLRAGADGYATETVEVTVGQGPASEARIALGRGAGLRGKVLDSRGRPASGVGVVARGEGDEGPLMHAATSVDGSFELSSLRPGRYALSAGSTFGGFGMAAAVVPGTEEVVLHLAPGGRLRVTARNADGSPADRAWVAVRRVDGTPSFVPSAGGSTAADGTTEFPSPAGVVEIEARKDALVGRGQATVVVGGVAALEITLSGAPPPPTP